MRRPADLGELDAEAVGEYKFPSARLSGAFGGIDAGVPAIGFHQSQNSALVALCPAQARPGGDRRTT